VTQYDIYDLQAYALDLSHDGRSVSVSVTPWNERSFWTMGRLGYLKGQALALYKKGPPLFPIDSHDQLVRP
jgi:hypothetical protein